MECPPELVWGLRTERWSQLPEAGGWLDQPAGLLDRCAHALDVWRALRAWQGVRAADQAAWIAANRAAYALVVDIRKLRAERAKRDGTRT